MTWRNSEQWKGGSARSLFKVIRFLFCFIYFYESTISCFSVLSSFSPLKKLKKICLLILEREERRERERNIDVREKHGLVASQKCPDWGSNLHPTYVPWLRIKPQTFWCMGWRSNHLSHLARTCSPLNCSHRTYNSECPLSSFHILYYLCPKFQVTVPQNRMHRKMHSLEGDAPAFIPCQFSLRCLPRGTPSIFTDKNPNDRVALAAPRLLFIVLSLEVTCW